MATTFQVHSVQTQRQHRHTVSAATAWQTRAKLQPEACSPGEYLDLPLNPLIGAIGIAYNQHRPLALSPDVIWLTIAQGFAFHINANAEALRPKFVKHEGKKYLEIRRDNFVKGSDIRYWGRATQQPDGTWRCLAVVRGCLCLVQVKLSWETP